MDLQTLTGDDAAAYKTLWLRALLEHPEAFGSSFEAEQAHALDVFVGRLENTVPDTYRLGAFESETLVGILGFFRRQEEKLHHKALLGGMYVVPEARHQGVGKSLLDEALRRAKSMVRLEELVLAVTVGNDSAKQLYVSAGFEVYCRDERFIRVDGHDFDIEWLKLKLY